jgi:hypothetical protein
MQLQNHLPSKGSFRTVSFVRLHSELIYKLARIPLRQGFQRSESFCEQIVETEVWQTI